MNVNMFNLITICILLEKKPGSQLFVLYIGKLDTIARNKHPK